MTQDPRPAPLVPAEVDLRDFQYMELDVQKLRDSRFTAETDPEAFRAGVLLWCAAWHQVPAASLPDNDKELSALAGFGRVVKEWMRYRDQALSLFVLCSDGRFYHPVIAEKAVVAWESRLTHKYNRLCDRIRKDNKQRALNGQPLRGIPTYDEWKAAGIPAEWPDDSGGIPAESSLKGKRRGRRRGNGSGTEKEQNLFTPSGGGAEAPATPAPKKRAAARKDEPPPTAAIWEAYSAAHRQRYGIEPARDATINGMLAHLVKRLGDEAPGVAAFYVAMNDPFFVKSSHPVKLLASNVETIRTQWKQSQSTDVAVRNGAGDRAAKDAKAAEIARVLRNESRPDDGEVIDA